MAGLRVFVSSTCYDLAVVRSQLRLFLSSLGHEPVLSDYNDVVYDPRIHTHTSCVNEVDGCDILVLVTGSRFGGTSVPEALTRIDFDALAQESHSIKILATKEKCSITQIEVLRAVELGIPVFSFVDEHVLHDHALYEKNKDKTILPDIDFPSIQLRDSAKYIFEFINFLRHRVRGNSVYPFSKSQDIEETLRRQWSGLLQRLLMEQRHHNLEARRSDKLASQLEDLKTVILTSIGTTKDRDIARGVVKFRRLVDFLTGLRIPDRGFIFNQTISWNDLLKAVGIIDVIDTTNFFDVSERRPRNSRPRTLLVCSDRTYYELRPPIDFLYEVGKDWAAFMELDGELRKVIFEALAEVRPDSHRFLRHRDRPIETAMANTVLFDAATGADVEDEEGESG
jgi:hypothetical protein